MKIAHIADLHFRLNSRFDQYKKCFSWFFDYLKKEEINNICVVGDCVHSYLNTTTELVENLSWFLKELNKFNTYILLGNHDLNIHNPNKKSIIEILINELELKNIVHFGKSGTYPINENANFVAYSLKDRQNWSNVSIDSEKINIGVFHGAVAGSLTSLGYKLPGEVEIGFFKDLDYVFLGDLHLRQFLAERKNFNGEKLPWAGYCGSPIAQNFAETGGKGGLIWDIKSKNDWSLEGFNIPNENPFITLNYEKDAFSLLKECQKHSPTSYFRITHSKEIPSAEKTQIRNELNQNGAKQVSFKPEIETDISTIKTKNISLKKKDLKEHKTHLKLLKEFLEGQDLSKDEWKLLAEISRKYINKINEEETHIFNKKWSIENMKFSNVYGYGENNNIHFGNLNGITGVFGKNKIGKSSFAGTISYGLFGASDRGSLRNLDIINNKKDNCSIEIDISCENKKYKIKRAIEKKKGKKKTSANASLELYELNPKNNEIKNNFNTVEKHTIENKIESIIGTKKDFFYTSFSAQEELKTFIKEGSTKRKLYINRFLGLDIFEKIYSLVKDDFDEIKAKMKNFGNKNWSIEIENLTKTKEQNKEELDKIKNKLINLNIKLDENKTNLVKLKYSNVEVSNPASIKKDIDDLKVKINVKNKDLKKLLNEKETLENRITKTETFLETFSIEKIDAEFEKLAQIEKSVSSLESQYKLELNVLENQKKSAQKLNTIPCGDQFPKCRFIKSSFIDKAKIPLQENKVNNFLDEIENIKNNLDKNKKEELKSQKEKFYKVKNLLSSLKVEEVKISNSISNIENELKRHNLKKDKLETLYISAKNTYNENTSNEIIELEEIINNLKKDVNELEEQKDILVFDNGKINTNIEVLKEEQEKYNKTKKKWKLFNLYLDAVGKKGISLQILNNQIPAINKEISNILDDVVDFKIELSADLSSNALDIFIIDDKGQRLIETGCGTEKVFASLALRIALIKLSNYISTWDTILLDESLDGLDNDNINECYKLFEMLKKEFANVIVITHKESIKAVADNIIEIDGKKGFSYINA